MIKKKMGVRVTLRKINENRKKNCFKQNAHCVEPKENNTKRIKPSNFQVTPINDLRTALKRVGSALGT